MISVMNVVTVNQPVSDFWVFVELYFVDSPRLRLTHCDNDIMFTSAGRMLQAALNENKKLLQIQWWICVFCVLMCVIQDL